MPTIESVLAREDEFYAAQTASDVEKLREIFAEELRFAHSTGAVETKDAYLRAVADGRYRHGEIWRIHNRTHVTEEGAVSIGVIDMTAKPADAPAYVMRLHQVLVWAQTPEGLRLTSRNAVRQPL